MLTVKKTVVAVTYVPMIWFITYLGLNSQAVAILSFLLVIDTITGFWKVKSLGTNPTSTRLANGVMSKMFLLIVPFVVALMAKGVGMDLSSFVVVVIDILIVSETYSILANGYTIINRKDVEEFDVMSFILKRIRGILNRVLGDEP